MDDLLTVFVYGTLRAGESNDIARAAARHALEAPRLLGESSLRGHLLDFGAYPGLVRDDAAEPVVGEVYEIAPALLPVLDAIEEIVPGKVCLFMREFCEIELDGRPLTCLYYPIRASSAHGLPRITGGDWVRFHHARQDCAA